MNVSETWFAEIESTVFTDVQYDLKTKPNAPFPNLNCTTVNVDDTLSKFPTMYLHELPSVEVGMDLTNRTVNAIRCTIEIQVFSNKSEQEVRKILAHATLVMKGLRFNVAAFPDPLTGNKIASGVARYTRIIGNGDKIVTGVE